MIGRLSHVAIAVPDLKKAVHFYENLLGAEVSKPKDLQEHGVTSVFVNLPNAKIELLHPLGENSPISNYLERNPGGGMHHLCYEVKDIKEAINSLKTKGVRILGEVKIGAHGAPVVFLHPKDGLGALIELEETK